MEPDPKPKLTVSLSVDIELIYKPFAGKTPDEIVEYVQDELHTLLFELDEVIGVTSDCTSFHEH
ncbi:MAG: hypothetical protein EBT86_12975 [Actinobacteria bacterium]|nr:hypothetical protein [Actinomycetota bacterium]